MQKIAQWVYVAPFGSLDQGRRGAIQREGYAPAVLRLSNIRSKGAARHMRLLATLDRALPGVRQPLVEPRGLAIGIAHLGCGHFLRGHQAVITERALAAHPGDPAMRGWGIAAASLVTPGARDALAPQDGLFSVLVRDNETTSPEIVGTLREVIYAPAQSDALVARMAAARIITLTVTEKGYCIDPASARLVPTHPDIVHDLSAAVPRNAWAGCGRAGQIRARGMYRHPSFPTTCRPTAACCDRRARLLAAARRCHAGRWIAANIASLHHGRPHHYPATTAADLAVAPLAWLGDHAAVVAGLSCNGDRGLEGRDRLAGWRRRIIADGAWECEAAAAERGPLGDGLCRRPSRLTTTTERPRSPTSPRWFAASCRRGRHRHGRPDPPPMPVYSRRWAAGLRHLLPPIAAEGSRRLPQRLIAPMRENPPPPAPCLHGARARRLMQCATGRAAARPSWKRSARCGDHRFASLPTGWWRYTWPARISSVRITLGGCHRAGDGRPSSLRPLGCSQGGAGLIFRRRHS
jgi:hypothetical protein